MTLGSGPLSSIQFSFFAPRMTCGKHREMRLAWSKFKKKSDQIKEIKKLEKNSSLRERAVETYEKIMTKYYKTSSK